MPFKTLVPTYYADIIISYYSLSWILLSYDEKRGNLGEMEKALQVK